MDFPECNSRAQDVALRHTERQVFICTVQGQQSQHLEYTQGAFLTFYIMFEHKESRWLAPGYPGNTDLHETSHMLRYCSNHSFIFLLPKLRPGSTCLQWFNLNSLVHSRSLILIRNPCYPSWTFYAESHALTVKAFPTLVTHKGRICYLCGEESCRARASASTSR